MGRWQRRLRQILPGSSRTDYAGDNAFRYEQYDAQRGASPIPFGRRRGSANGDLYTSHFGVSYSEGRTMRLTSECQDFIQQVTRTGLSQLLIWYLYHDVVPENNLIRPRFKQLPREELVGWIRFGYELGMSMAAHDIRQLPIRLLHVFEELGLDARHVVRILIRLSKEDQMLKKELTGSNFNNASAYLAAGEKLEADLRLLRALKPISQTVYVQWREEAMDWIDAFMSVVIRPAVDLTQPRQSLPNDSSRRAAEKNIKSKFQRIYEPHEETNFGSVYTEALGSRRWDHANESVRARQTLMSQQNHMWISSTIHGQASRQSNATSQEHRRRSAPLFEEGARALISMEDRFDALREDFARLLGGAGGRASPRADQSLDMAREESDTGESPRGRRRTRTQSPVPALEEGSESQYSAQADQHSDGATVVPEIQARSSDELNGLQRSKALKSTPDLRTLGANEGSSSEVRQAGDDELAKETTATGRNDTLSGTKSPKRINQPPTSAENHPSAPGSSGDQEYYVDKGKGRMQNKRDGIVFPFDQPVQVKVGIWGARRTLGPTQANGPIDTADGSYDPFAASSMNYRPPIPPRQKNVTFAGADLGEGSGTESKKSSLDTNGTAGNTTHEPAGSKSRPEEKVAGASAVPTPPAEGVAEGEKKSSEAFHLQHPQQGGHNMTSEDTRASEDAEGIQIPRRSGVSK